MSLSWPGKRGSSQPMTVADSIHAQRLRAVRKARQSAIYLVSRPEPGALSLESVPLDSLRSLGAGP
jgi:hypothetical protein